ncbi:MAG: hypothetical protein ACT4O5_12370 [Gammaproteobacteria bacterium]
MTNSLRRATSALMAAALISVAGPSSADGECTITAGLASQVRALIRPGMTLVHYCEACDESGYGPFPLRVRQLALTPEGPEEYWLNGKKYTEAELKQAKEKRSGRLVEDLRKDGQTEDWMIDASVKSLEMARAQRDHALRINGKQFYADYVYLPRGQDRYRNLAVQIRCIPDPRPRELEYTLLVRDSAKERPPPIYVAEDSRCQDGSCASKVWTARQEVTVQDKPASEGRAIAKLTVGEKVRVIKTMVYVAGTPAKVVWDHERFFEGDVFYLLDGQGEGHYRVWHYGETVIQDLSNASKLVDGTPTCKSPSDECWAEFADYPEEMLWTQVRRESGDEGWVLADPEFFDGIYEDY